MPERPTPVDPLEAMAEVRADFWRCDKCLRLCTKPEMDQALGIGGTGRACPCGSMRYRPANLPWWGWLLPRVWRFAWLRTHGRA